MSAILGQENKMGNRQKKGHGRQPAKAQESHGRGSPGDPAVPGELRGLRVPRGAPGRPGWMHKKGGRKWARLRLPTDSYACTVGLREGGVLKT